MSEAIRAYPLQWPPGWKRTESYRRKNGKFKSYGRGLSVIDGCERVLEQLAMLKVSRDDTVISTNVPTRLDGLPKGAYPDAGDPGVAVYWRKGKATQCMAIDGYSLLADNLAAIAATLEAMRAIERHGGAEILDRAFTGFTALPAPEQWFQVLGVSANASRDEIERAYRRLVAEHHPDRGGDNTQMARINVARDEGLEARR